MCSRKWDSTTHVRPSGQLAGTVSGLQAQIDFARAIETERGSEWLRLLSPKRTQRTVRAASELRSPRRLEGRIGPPAEKLVKTHCCFCGQQCGIQLKVRENHVIGFEPWEEFPFNRGMLCPKGVKRYLQDNHPDRLLSIR